MADQRETEILQKKGVSADVIARSNAAMMAQLGQKVIPLVWLPKSAKRLRSMYHQRAGLTPRSGEVGPMGTALRADMANVSGHGDKDYEHGATISDYEEYQKDTEPNADEVSTWVYDPKRRGQIIKFLHANGYPLSEMTPDDVEKVWSDAVGRASDAYMGSGKKLKVSPWDMLKLFAPKPQEGKKPPKGLKWSSTSTVTDVADIPPEQARSVLHAALQQALGRAPTDEEIEDFASRANAIAMANPQVTTTTQTHEWDPDLEQYMDTNTNRRSTGGVTPDMLQGEAMDEARKNPEHDVAQAANFYMPGFMAAISSPVPEG